MQKEGAFKVFAHTDARNPQGYDLELLAKRTGIGKYVIFQSIKLFLDKILLRLLT